MIRAGLWACDPDAGTLIAGRGVLVASPGGYAQTSIAGQTVLAHRVIYEYVHGPIPAGLVIDHMNGEKTDNRIINLEAVSQSENVRRARILGLVDRKGERNTSAKLKAFEVVQIRRLAAAGASRQQLAVRFGVSPSLVSLIVRGKRWKSVIASE